MFDKLNIILGAQTDNLRQLARLVGGDFNNFYRGADLRGADLRGQDLRGIDFTGANFKGALFDENTKIDVQFANLLRFASFQSDENSSPNGTASSASKTYGADTKNQREANNKDDRPRTSSSLDCIRIIGGRPLEGSITISGAKNAALPVMAASLLTDSTVSITNVPQVADVFQMLNVLSEIGVRNERFDFEPSNPPEAASWITLSADKIDKPEVTYETMRRFRASTLVLGPLLARAGEARVSLPGGCAFGTRPIDLHLSGLEKMGAEIKLDGGYVEAKARKGLRGCNVSFPHISVGATENLMMAACLAKGETTLSNVAREPEVVDLANCLVAMGADIAGIGSDTLTISGVESLNGTQHRVVADRIEAGTYAMAVGATGGNVELIGAEIDELEAVTLALKKVGLEIEATDRGLRVQSESVDIRGTDIMTEPYPGFPSDLQPPFTTLMSIANGASMITETVFENRFMHIPELRRMGADINVHGASAVIRGVSKLYGTEVTATDVRAGASLVLAGLVAEGETTVNRIYHIDRGYGRMVEKLAACNAQIERTIVS